MTYVYTEGRTGIDRYTEKYKFDKRKFQFLNNINVPY